MQQLFDLAGGQAGATPVVPRDVERVGDVENIVIRDQTPGSGERAGGGVEGDGDIAAERTVEGLAMDGDPQAGDGG